MAAGDPASDGARWWEAFRANWAESLLAVLGVAAIAASLTRLDTYAGPLLAGLLLFPTLGLAAAPVNSLAAQRAALPPQLRERRRTEWLRDRRTIAGGAVAGGTVGVLAAMAVVLALLLAPSPHLVRPPQVVDPGRGKPARPTPVSPAPSGTTPSRTGGSTSPSPTRRTPSPTTGSPTTAPSASPSQ